jgi:hypothetical protein
MLALLAPSPRQLSLRQLPLASSFSLQRIHTAPPSRLRVHVLGESWLGNTGLADSVTALSPTPVPLFTSHSAQSLDVGWCVAEA